MGVITIARLLGAGETTIAPAVANRLGWKVADQSILNREAEITGISLPQASQWDEHDPSMIEKLHGKGPEFAEFVKTSRHSMLQLAKTGNVVIVGRGGNLLLRGQPSTLNLRLIADMPFRIRRVMEARWCSEQVARHMINKSDRNKALFYKHVMRVDWNDPMLYDIVLRTDLLGIERVIDILVAYFQPKTLPALLHTAQKS